MRRSAEVRRCSAQASAESLEDRKTPRESNHPPGRISSYRHHSSVYMLCNASFLIQRERQARLGKFVSRSSIPDVMPRSIAFRDAPEGAIRSWQMLSKDATLRSVFGVNIQGQRGVDPTSAPSRWFSNWFLSSILGPNLVI